MEETSEKSHGPLLRDGSKSNVDIISEQSSPFLHRAPSEIEIKMSTMRERFRTLQMMEEIENIKEFEGDELELQSEEQASETSHRRFQNKSASARWGKLKKVIKNDIPDPNATRKSGISIQTSPRLSRQSTAKDQFTIEMEDIKLMEFWNKNPLDDLMAEDKFPVDLTLPSETVEENNDFDEEAKLVSVVVNKVPEEMVEQRQSQMAGALFEEQSKVLDNIKKKEVDVIWRENLARKRLKEIEIESKEKLEAEKLKVLEISREKETALSKDYRRMREGLEKGIKRQEAAIKEVFGRVLVHEESISRKFHVSTRMAPQAVEIRVHILRAVKSKLPKGNYLLMLTQYDALGGHPLSWSAIGANGIGMARPGVTKMFRHMGRYFDRTLKVEDSVFALCPPRPLLRPSFVFVFELFQLSGKQNPVDKIVGWTAMPMAYESMSLVEGKIKLPLLHGHHSSAIQHFKHMEHSIANDLDNWLCNMYLEVRHVSLGELGATQAMLKPVEFDLDYLNKTITGDDAGFPDPEWASRNLSVKTYFTKSKEERKLLNPPKSDIESFVEEDNMSARMSEKGGVPETNESVFIAAPGGVKVDKGIFRRKNTNNNNDKTGNNEDGTFAVKEVENENNMDSAGEEDALLDPNQLKQKPSEKDLNNSKKHKNSSSAHNPTIGSFFSSLFGKNQTAIAPDGGKKDDDEQEDDIEAPKLKFDKQESFQTQKGKLVDRWKHNIRMKAPKFDNSDNIQIAVRERGFYIPDESYLHKQQRGKLSGLEAVGSREDRRWAAAGLEGPIVRRWQAEGPRFDTEAINDGTGRESQPPSPRGENAINKSLSKLSAVSGKENNPQGFDQNPANMYPMDPFHVPWEELKDPREMEDYSMSLASDPAKRKSLMPGSKARSKLRYMYLELFGDFQGFKWGTFDFYVAAIIMIFALWFRIYVHYLAQYLFLLSLRTPVFDFRLGVIQIIYKYMSESISTSAEVGVVAIGPIANVCLFLILFVIGLIFFEFTKFVPEVISKFIASFGVVAVLNPILVMLIDLCLHNYECKNISGICSEDYTSSDCDCFNGDFYKLWARMERVEGSGLTGLIITLMLYCGCATLAMLILYMYLVHVHRDGRILDLWRRVSAPAEEFLIPRDFEISKGELQSIVSKSQYWRGPKGARRRLVVEHGVDPDPIEPTKEHKYKRYIIYEINSEKTVNSIYRQFILDEDGVIVEVFRNSGKRRQKSFKNLFVNTLEAGEGENGLNKIEEEEKENLEGENKIDNGDGKDPETGNDEPENDNEEGNDVNEDKNQGEGESEEEAGKNWFF